MHSLYLLLFAVAAPSQLDLDAQAALALAAPMPAAVVSPVVVIRPPPSTTCSCTSQADCTCDTCHCGLCNDHFEWRPFSDGDPTCVMCWDVTKNVQAGTWTYADGKYASCFTHTVCKPPIKAPAKPETKTVACACQTQGESACLCLKSGQACHCTPTHAHIFTVPAAKPMPAMKPQSYAPTYCPPGRT